MNGIVRLKRRAGNADRSEITGTDFTAKVWYASCHATIGEDVNWGGGYDCEFFIVRENKEALLAEVKRLTKRAADLRQQPPREIKYVSGANR